MSSDQIVRLLLFILCVVPAGLAFIAFLVMVWSMCKISSQADAMSEQVIHEMIKDQIKSSLQDQNIAVK